MRQLMFTLSNVPRETHETQPYLSFTMLSCTVVCLTCRKASIEAAIKVGENLGAPPAEMEDFSFAHSFKHIGLPHQPSIPQNKEPFSCMYTAQYSETTAHTDNHRAVFIIHHNG
jgi:hypothetical protein